MIATLGHNLPVPSEKTSRARVRDVANEVPIDQRNPAVGSQSLCG